MTGRGVRTGLVAAFAAAAIGFVAWIGCSNRKPQETTRPAAPASTAAAPTTLPQPPRRRAENQPAAPADAPPAHAPTEDAPLETDTFPRLDVIVLDSDGDPVQLADVYALVPGGAGGNVVAEFPHAKTHGGGISRLPLPRAGTYDVAVVARCFHAIASDVLVPRTEPLRIVLPPRGTIEVLADADVLPAKDLFGRRCSQIVLRSAGDDTAVRFPGRGQPLAWAAQRQVEPPMRWVTDAQVGAAFGFDVDPRIALEPAAGKAPAVVRLTRSAAQFPVSLALTFAPANSTFETPCEVAIAIDWGPDAICPMPIVRSWTSAESRSLFNVGTGAFVPSPSGVVSWSGRGVRPGSVRYDALERDLIHTVVAVVQIDSDEPPPPVPMERRSRAAVLHVDGDRRSGGAADWRCGSVGGTCDVGAEVQLTLVPGKLFASATRDDEVAGPIELAASGGIDAKLHLVAGGTLVLALDAPLPEGLPPAQIARKDGLPLLVRGVAGPSGDVAEGGVVGPLPAGDVEFVVTIAGVVVGQPKATVVAGRAGTLQLPRFEPR